MADYTPADVELVRKAIRTTPACPDWAATEPALAGLPCDACEARAVLSALSATGRLRDDDAETRTDWGVRLTWDDGRGHDDKPAEDEADARCMVDYHRRQKVEQAEVGRVWLVTPSLITRTRQLGPWQPVTEGIDG